MTKKYYRYDYISPKANLADYYKLYYKYLMRTISLSKRNEYNIVVLCYNRKVA